MQKRMKLLTFNQHLDKEINTHRDRFPGHHAYGIILRDAEGFSRQQALFVKLAVLHKNISGLRSI